MLNKSMLDKPAVGGDHSQYVLTSGERPMEELVLTPKVSSDSIVEGTIFYCSTDNHVYVGTE